MRRVVKQAFPSPLARDEQHFGAAVRAARTRAGMPLADAALALGVSKDTLSKLETGQGSVALPTALRIARALGVAVLAAPFEVHEQAARFLNELRAADPVPWGDEQAREMDTVPPHLSKPPLEGSQ